MSYKKNWTTLILVGKKGNKVMGQIAETFYQVMIRERVFAFLIMWSFVNPFKRVGDGIVRG